MSVSSTPALLRRGKDIKPSNNAMDIESIRSRRAKLENILNTRRPRPLSRDLTSLSHPSLLKVGVEVPPTWPARRRHSTDAHRVFSDPLALHPIPSFPYISPYARPLPGIGKSREMNSYESTPAQSRQSSGKRKTPDASSTNTGEKRPSTGGSQASTDTDGEDNGLEDLQYTQATLEEIVKGIGSSNHERCLKNTIRARKLLSKEDGPPIEEFLQAGILPPLISLLQQEDDSNLQFEATWALTNLAAGNSDQTSAVVEAGSVPILIYLLGSKTMKVQEQAAWALGNIAGDGHQFRTHLVSQGIVTSLLDTINGRDGKSAQVSLVRVATWVLSNLFRYKDQKLPEQELAACVNAISDLLIYPDSEVNIDALWAASYIAETDDEGLQEVVSAPGAVASIVRHLSCSDKHMVTPALRAVGNIVAGNDEHTDAVVDAGALPILTHLLRTGRQNIKKEAAWAISNITAGNENQIQKVIDTGVLPDLIAALSESFLDVQREATWAIGNLTSGGNEEQVKELLEAGGVAALVQILARGEANIMDVALTTLDNILKVEEVSQEAKTQIVAAKGVELLEALDKHVNESIREKASGILETYFREDQHEDDQEQDTNSHLDDT
ncbi:importin subunit alpha-1-like [Procambarus clarkii]|uniref:importin subunit alpha-1-like n=1 Tax=Procambarus clarkii TaxID=6728 RepID=UPI0037436A08